MQIRILSIVVAALGLVSQAAACTTAQDCPGCGLNQDRVCK